MNNEIPLFDIIKKIFELEIDNDIEINGNELTVHLGDNTKAKISIKKAVE